MVVLCELAVLASLFFTTPDHLLYSIMFIGWAILFKIDATAAD
jgi:hypothetical protein